jgi:DNA polymerase V
MEVMLNLYDRIIDPDLMIRRVNVVACDLIPEDEIPADAPFQMDLFTDYETLDRQKFLEKAEDKRERNLQKATLLLQEKFGKNAVLKGMNLKKGAMTISRNGQIGAHKAE